jgi:hypothetical protein
VQPPRKRMAPLVVRFGEGVTHSCVFRQCNRCKGGCTPPDPIHVDLCQHTAFQVCRSGNCNGKDTGREAWARGKTVVR